MRKLIALVLAVAMMLVVAGCGGADEKKADGDKQIKMGFSQIGAESEWRTANTESVKQAAKDAGIDLQFSVMKESKNKEAAYEVLRFLFEDETVQIYLDDQGGIPCKEGEFSLPSFLNGMEQYIKDNRMSDYHDHHYPSEMSVDALIQTYLMDSATNSAVTFLDRFDNEWIRYNRDLIAKVKKYEEGQK